MAEVTDVTVKKRILIQLGVPFFALVGFVVAVIIFGTLYFAGQLKSVEGAGDSKSVATSLQASLENFFSETKISIEKAAISLRDETPTETEESTLRAILSSNPTLLAFGYFDENGTQLYELHKRRAEEELLLAVFKGDTYTALVKQNPEGYINIRTTETGGTYFVWAVPRYDDENIFAGILTVGIDATVIKDIFNGLASLSPLKIQLVDAITSASGIFVNTLPEDVVDASPSESTIRTLFDNNKQSYGYITDSGSKIEGRWEAVSGTPWNITVEVPKSGLPDNAGDLFVIAAIVLIIFVLLVFYYLHVINKNLILPLTRIEKTMHYFKTGDYSELVKVKTKNEFIVIADQLNSMSKHIENNTSERVAQLKKVLARQNTDTKLLIEKDVELRDKGQKLKELDQAKSMFVSVAAHQMRTPLAAIKWSVKLVMDGDVGPVNAEQKEYLGKGYESTTRMINLINDLLDVDKIESDKFSYTFKEYKLEKILQGIVDDLMPFAKEKGVNLIFQKEVSEYPSISADEVKLRNALQNLIDNAIKYTIGGGDVTVKLALDKDILRLSITDTGIGIPLSEQSKVFGKFFRAKNAVRQETDGSGLGLFIVKKIIEKHNGEARFESKEGKGTTFFITLPSKGSGGVPITKESSTTAEFGGKTTLKETESPSKTAKTKGSVEVSKTMDKQEEKK